jgi:hypothetical protein
MMINTFMFLQLPLVYEYYMPTPALFNLIFGQVLSESGGIGWVGCLGTSSMFGTASAWIDAFASERIL